VTSPTYGRQQHVIQQQCDGDDDKNEPPGLPASLQPTAPVSTSHYWILSFFWCSTTFAK